MKRFIGLTALVAGLGIALSACSPVVPLAPAKDAASVDCANAYTRFPDAYDNLKKRSTNAQSTAAYGDPEAVLIRCGVEMPVQSDDACFDVNGVDWIADSSRDPDYVFVSYGRSPAIEVVVDNNQISGRAVLEELTSAALVLEKKHSCLGLDDAENQNVLGK